MTLLDPIRLMQLVWQVGEIVPTEVTEDNVEEFWPSFGISTASADALFKAIQDSIDDPNMPTFDHNSAMAMCFAVGILTGRDQ